MTEHLIASTLTALVAVAAAAALRRRSAKLRFALFLAGVLRFAVPTSWLSGLGEQLAHQVPAYINTGITKLAGVSLLLGMLPGMPKPEGMQWGMIAAAVWIGGAVLTLGLSSRRWFPRMDAVREATEDERNAVLRAWDRLRISQRVDVRVVGAGEVPAACGVLRPFIALPDGLVSALTPSELDAVLWHELAHIARHDNLWATLVRIVVCVFWFHPLVWWIEQRLMQERETACDEFVLAHGAGRQEYVTGIAKVCRIAFLGPPPCAGITGSNLKARATHILTVDLRSVFGGPVSLAPALFGIAALLLPVTAGFLAAQPPLEERLRAAVAEGDIDAAIELLEAHAAKNPLDGNLLLQLAGFYLRIGRHGAAIDLYEQLLYSDPNSGDLLFRLAEAYRRAGNLERALDLFERAANYDPFKPDAFLQQALILDGTGQRDRARPVYEKVLEVEPDHVIAANNLAFLLADEGGDLERALTLALRAYQRLPQSADIADTLGVVYLKNDMPEQALAAFHTALAKNIDSAGMRSHLLAALDRVHRPTPEMLELRALLREPVNYRAELRIGSLLKTLPVLE